MLIKCLHQKSIRHTDIGLSVVQPACGNVLKKPSNLIPIAGINPNPYVKDVSYFEITPHFINALDFAKAEYTSHFGEIKAEWRRKGDKIILSITVPPRMKCKIRLPKGYTFDDNTKIKNLNKEDKVQNLKLNIL